MVSYSEHDNGLVQSYKALVEKHLKELKAAEEREKQYRRALDNIKVRAYELGQRELHDMALDALMEKDSDSPRLTPDSKEPKIHDTPPGTGFNSPAWYRIRRGMPPNE